MNRRNLFKTLFSAVAAAAAYPFLSKQVAKAGTKIPKAISNFGRPYDFFNVGVFDHSGPVDYVLYNDVLTGETIPVSLGEYRDTATYQDLMARNKARPEPATYLVSWTCHASSGPSKPVCGRYETNHAPDRCKSNIPPNPTFGEWVAHDTRERALKEQIRHYSKMYSGTPFESAMKDIQRELG